MQFTTALLTVSPLPHPTQKGSCPDPGWGLPDILQITPSSEGLTQGKATSEGFLDAEN